MKPCHLALLSIAALAACSSNPPPASPAPMPAPAPAPAAPAPAASTATARDVTGNWDFTVDAGGQTVSGEMVVTRVGAGFGGTVTPQGMSAATIRSVTITGDRIVLVVDSPDGEATFNGTLSTDNRTITGNLAFNGQSMGFSMRKR